MVRKKSSQRPSQKKESPVKKIADHYFDRVVSILVVFIEEQLHVLIRWMKNVSQFKQVIRKSLISAALLITGTVLVLLGVSQWVQTYFNLQDYAANLILGFLIIVIGMLYMKS